MLIIWALTLIWLWLRFPLVVKIKEEDLYSSCYDNIYTKKIGFWQNLFIGFFDLLKQNNIISLLGGYTMELGTRGRDCKIIIKPNFSKLSQNAFDVILTVFCGIAAFFISSEFAKLGVVFGLVFSTYMIISLYKKYILNYIYSITVNTQRGYKINVMYPYRIFDGIFSKYYGFAYLKFNAILLHKDVFCGGDKLRNYIIAHEEGHLANKSSIKINLAMYLFIFATFLGISSGNVMYGIWGIDDYRSFIPLILYLLFLAVYLPLAKAQEEKLEKCADTYAIKKLGKDAVIDGLEIIKSDNFEDKCNLSGTPLNRRIEFVKEYSET